MINIPFSPPFIDLDIIGEVLDTISSGWITSGPKVKMLEEEVSKIAGVSRTVCVNSWTSGAVLALKWFGIQEGDEVIIPAYTYCATALAVMQCGATPVMVDISDDFTINVQAIRKAITAKTKAIIPVDFAGWPCDYSEIRDLVENEDIMRLFKANSEKQSRLGRILVISDAAHSIGAHYKGLPVGKLADITIFSFHAVKNITTAEGGAICLNLPFNFNINDEYNLMKLYSLNGQNKDAYTKSLAGAWKYDILFAGLKVNMPDVCAAIGLAQIRKYNDILIQERERVACAYHNFFGKYSEFELPPINDENRKSCFHLYALRINNCNEEKRDLIIEEITRFGISVNVHFIPMPLLTLFKNMGYKIGDYPVAYDNYSREISLPIYPQLTNDQIEIICEIVFAATKKVLQT
jgi:dTDP-4-amino-4,6-dideoxygalactose transaminase